MTVARALETMGGVSTRATLIAATSRAEVDRALRHGEVVRGAPGRYTLPGADLAVRVAHESSGALCLTSAALHHGWEVKQVPDLPHVIYPKKRKIPSWYRSRVQVHRGDLHADQVEGIATSRLQTLEMCLRSLPFDEALAVADSALRHDDVLPRTLQGLAISARGPGSRQMRRVALAGRAEAANPFESVLRAIALDAPGLSVEPQRVIRGRRVWARPDLVDAQLCIVLEADSFEWHGGRAALDRDAHRYNRLAVEGWLVLRFSWEAVMFRPHEVREILLDAVACVTGRTHRAHETPRAA
jgi:very-short-patch-repair endonuclease